jgi:N6-L-threonylcarbamoyladenine synthase
VSGGETLLLAIESSCDETGIALVAGGRRIVAQAVASQVALHAPAGGIVPELAARAHLRWMVPTLAEVLEIGGVTIPEVDGIAVTAGPGLAGSLLVGVAFAKTLAWSHRRPLVGINHLEGHLYAAWLLDPDEPDRPAPPFPLVALVVSGGHTFLVEMRDHLVYRLLGETVDDAAGEAFDKAGRLLGLGYPGGPAIAAAATDARHRDAVLPRAWLRDSYDFSFSGLKTALRRQVEGELAAAGRPGTEAGGRLDPARVAELAWGFQEAVVDVLAAKTLRAADETGARAVVLGGGVASNEGLRARIGAGAAARGLPLFVPRPGLCTDNGAMIGAAGWHRFGAGERAGSDLGVRPAWPLVRPAGALDTRRPPRRGAAARAYEAARAAERAAERDAAGHPSASPTRRGAR